MVGKVNPMIYQEHKLITTAVVPRNNENTKCTYDNVLCALQNHGLLERQIWHKMQGYGAETFLPTPQCETWVLIGRFSGLENTVTTTGCLAALCIVLTPQP